jgi:hypothetical protein
MKQMIWTLSYDSLFMNIFFSSAFILDLTCFISFYLLLQGKIFTRTPLLSNMFSAPEKDLIMYSIRHIATYKRGER